jgi:hypothetical protein
VLGPWPRVLGAAVVSVKDARRTVTILCPNNESRALREHEMRPHPARIVCLDKRIDVSRVERALGELRVYRSVERANDDEVVGLHTSRF